MLPGGRVLASADESGMVAACDMRMLGGSPSTPGSPGSSQRLLWSLRPESGGITCLEAGLHASSGKLVYPSAHGALAAMSISHPCLPAGMPMLVAGTKSGHVHVIAAESGKIVQSMVVGQGRSQQSKGFFSSSKSSNTSLVTGLSLTPDGLTISSFTGATCAVRFAGWAC